MATACDGTVEAMLSESASSFGSDVEDNLDKVYTESVNVRITRFCPSCHCKNRMIVLMTKWLPKLQSSEPHCCLLSSCNYVTKTRDKALPCGKKVLCSMATERKSVSNSRSLRNICWIYPAR